MRRIIYKTICCVLLFTILLTSGLPTLQVQANEADTASNELSVGGTDMAPAIGGDTKAADMSETTTPGAIGSDPSAESADVEPAVEGAMNSIMPMSTAAIPPTTIINAPTLAENVPVIDGDIDGVEWSQAAQSRSFFHFGKGSLISEGTAFKVRFTEDTLYLAVRCEQLNPPKAVLTAHDSDIYNEERVEVFFQPDRNDSTYYQFIVNAIGTTFEGKGFDRSWGGDGSGWKSAVSYHDGYWAVEIALPANLFGLQEFADGEYGLNVCRSQLIGGETTLGPLSSPGYVSSTWSPYAGGTWHDPSSFGVLTKGRNVYVDVKRSSYDTSGGLVTDVTIVNLGETPLPMWCLQEVVAPSGAVVTFDETVEVAAGGTLDVRLRTNLAEIGSYKQGLIFIIDQSIGQTLYLRKLALTIDPPIRTKCYWLEENRVIASLDPKDATRDFIPNSGSFSLYQGTTLLQEKPAALVDGIWTADFSFENLEPGEYLLKASLTDGNNTVELPGSSINKPETPVWWDSQLGNEDIVLAPWTGIKLSANTVSTWGREYRFGDSPFVSQIKSQGEDILAGPVKIIGQAGGQTLGFYETGESYEEKSDTRVSYVNTSESDEIQLTVKSTVEYDGLVRFDVHLSSERPVELQDLKVAIPVKPEFATLFDADTTDSVGQGTYPYWGGAESGLFPDEAEGNFTPQIFIGNDKVGLVWVAESTKNWFFQDKNKVLRLRKETDAHTLEMNVVDKSITISKEEPLEFTFALQATPVKPESKYPSFAMYGWYGMEAGKWTERTPDDGRLIYPAKDYVTLEQGELTVNVAPNYPVEWQIFYPPEDPRSDSQTPIVAVQFPNQSGFGLYYSLNNQNLYLEAYTQQNHDKTRHLFRQFKLDTWGRGQSMTDDDAKDYRDVKLKWENGQIEVWIGGVKMAEAPLNPNIFNAGIQEAQITFGSNFIYDYFSNGTTTVQCEDTSINNRVLNGKSTQTPGGRINLTFSPVYPDIRTPLEILKASGAQMVHLHEQWTESQGYPMTKNTNTEAALKSLTSASNALGMQVLPYVGFQLGDNTEEFKNFKDDIVVEPFFLESGWNRGDHIGANISYAGRYQNFMLWGIEKLMKEDGIGGLYMDGTCMPPVDKNIHHGTGYYDRDGVLQASYPIFEYRNFFKRLRTIVKAYRPDFWMDMHTVVGAWTPISGFGDSLWKGEQLIMGSSTEELFRERVKLDVLRAGMGRQTGLAGYFLNYYQVPTAEAINSLLNIPVRLDGELVNKVLKYYDLERKNFVPYYENGIISTNETAFMSYFRRPDGVVVAVTANLSQQNQPADVTFTLPEGLILDGSMATDAINGDNMTLDGNRLTVHFEEAWRQKYILLAPESVEKPVRYPFEWPHIGFPVKD